jgi:hypothetical protein
MLHQGRKLALTAGFCNRGSLNACFAPKATELLRGSEMTRRANKRHRTLENERRPRPHLDCFCGAMLESRAGGIINPPPSVATDADIPFHFRFQAQLTFRDMVRGLAPGDLKRA